MSLHEDNLKYNLFLTKVNILNDEKTFFDKYRDSSKRKDNIIAHIQCQYRVYYFFRFENYIESHSGTILCYHQQYNNVFALNLVYAQFNKQPGLNIKQNTLKRKRYRLKSKSSLCNFLSRRFHPLLKNSGMNLIPDRKYQQPSHSILTHYMDSALWFLWVSMPLVHLIRINRKKSKQNRKKQRSKSLNNIIMINVLICIQ